MNMPRQLLGDVRFSRQLKTTTINRWPTRIQGNFRSFDMHTPPAVGAMQFDLCLLKSNVAHRMAETGNFVRRTFYAKDTVAYFFGALMYGGLSKEKGNLKQYGNYLHVVTSLELTQKAISIQVTQNLRVAGLEGSAVSVPFVKTFLLPACLARAINDRRYFSHDRVMHSEMDRCGANVIFKSSKETRKTVKDFIAHNCVYSVASRTTQSGKKLFVYFGRKFSFSDYRF